MGEQSAKSDSGPACRRCAVRVIRDGRRPLVQQNKAGPRRSDSALTGRPELRPKVRPEHDVSHRVSCPTTCLTDLSHLILDGLGAGQTVVGTTRQLSHWSE